METNDVTAATYTNQWFRTRWAPVSPCLSTTGGAPTLDKTLKEWEILQITKIKSLPSQPSAWSQDGLTRTKFTLLPEPPPQKKPDTFYDTMVFKTLNIR